MLKRILTTITIIVTLGVSFTHQRTAALAVLDQGTSFIALESNSNVDIKTCRKAVKILTQYERLASERGINLPPHHLGELNRLRDVGKIKIGDLPATLQREFPSELAGMTLEEIQKLCGMK